jgi:6-phosphogluconolactonase (cycloisomerase 2 family)
LADGRIVTADLGADRLHVHTLVGGTLVRESSVALPAGTGPRDLHVLSNGLIVLLGEFGCELHVLAVADDSSISLTFSVPLPGAVAGDQAAAIAVTGDERFVYSGLRGSNRISFSPLTLDTDPAGRPGVRFAPGGFVSAEGDWPRHLTVDGDILHVANQRSSGVASFSLGADGTPTLIAEPTHVASPTVLAKA